MNQIFRLALCFSCSISVFAQPSEQTLPREEWGAPLVNVSHAYGKWIIAGRKQTVSLNETNFAIEIHAGPATWVMAPSTTNDMIVKTGGNELPIRLADTGRIAID